MTSTPQQQTIEQPKTIHSILEELERDHISWIHDQLDGTSMVNENLEQVERDIDQALAEIGDTFNKCKPENLPMKHEHETGYAAGYNDSSDEYQSNLHKALGKE